jgi:hypothetical protein
VFYSDGVNGVYRSSMDGVAWGAPTTFGVGGHFGHRFGGWFDGEHFHYVICTANLGEDVRYRCGLPRADGSIDWLAAEQVVYDTPSDKNVMYPKLTVDAAGRTWIAFMELVYQEPNAPPYDAVVLASEGEGGMWALAKGFPFRLVDAKAVAGYPDVLGVPLGSGGVCWIYNVQRDGKDVYASRLWNGDTWEDEAIVSWDASPYAFFSAVSWDDTVHLVHGAGKLCYQRWSHEAGWGAPVTVAEGASGHSSITSIGVDRVAVTWLDLAENAVCCRLYGGGALASETSCRRLPRKLAGGINLNTSAVADAGGDVIAAYTTEGDGAFNLEIVWFEVPE